jgi:hypothetical protein
MTDGPDIEQRWYWDHRTNKAYYPKTIDEEEGVVELVTAWHHEEVTDALETGALTAVEELSEPYDAGVGFECFDSFRFDAVEDDPTVSEAVDDE